MSCGPLHHLFRANCHPSCPPGACLCVSLALGLLLKMCCSSFTKRGSEQFYTPFDLCSGIRSSLRLPPPGKKCASSNPASCAPTEPTSGPGGADPRSWVSGAVTWPFLLDFLSRGSRPRTSVTGTFTGGLSYGQKTPEQAKSLGDRWATFPTPLKALPKVPLPVCVAGTCLPSSSREGRVGMGSHQASCEPVFLAAGPASLDSLSRQRCWPWLRNGKLKSHLGCHLLYCNGRGGQVQRRRMISWKVHSQ